jgi:hypothetical protein
VGQQRHDGFERAASAGGAAGEVDDEGGSDGAADGTAERRVEGFAEAGGAHAFAEAVDEALADELGGLGGDVARGEAGAAGGDDEVCIGGVLVEGFYDEIELVGEGLGVGFVDTGGGEHADDLGTGGVFLLAFEAAVADGEDHCPETDGEPLFHLSSVMGDRLGRGMAGCKNEAYRTNAPCWRSID